MLIQEGVQKRMLYLTLLRVSKDSLAKIEM